MNHHRIPSYRLSLSPAGTLAFEAGPGMPALLAFDVVERGYAQGRGWGSHWGQIREVAEQEINGVISAHWRSGALWYDHLKLCWRYLL